MITNPKLKISGNAEQIVHYPKYFEGMTFSKMEIIEIINKDRNDDETAQVQYTFINFEEMLRKI